VAGVRKVICETGLHGFYHMAVCVVHEPISSIGGSTWTEELAVTHSLRSQVRLLTSYMSKSLLLVLLISKL
jgi:hypothetical protein